jgi:hypothetical protein
MERIPYVLASAITAIKDQADSQTATQIRNFDVKSVIDNSVVDRLVKEGYFEQLFGAGNQRGDRSQIQPGISLERTISRR